jgi:hypothetical protein
LLVTHPACLAHDMGEGHPERPERCARSIARSKRGVSVLARDNRAARRRSRRSRASIPPNMSPRSSGASPKQGRVALDADTADVAGHLEAALCARPAARSSRSMK